jgi:microcin C transport system substrate-binding protein
MRVSFLFTLLFGCSFAIAKTALVVGNPAAPQGGTFYTNLTSEPDILNPIYSSEAVAATVNGYVVDGLLYQNPETYEFEPGMAEKYEVSKDGKTFTFHLRKGLVFSDGTPVTSDDVRFSVECVRNPAFKAMQRVSYYDELDKIETPDPLTIRFLMKKKYFKNLEVLGTAGFTPIVPKATYGDPSKNLSKVSIGSGPYKIDKYDHGKTIEIVRNPGWWGYKTKTPLTAGSGKFDRIVFRFIKDFNLQIEMLKKGQIDFLDFVQPEQFVQKAVGEPFGSEIIKHKEDNQDPVHKTFNFVAWNLKNPIFQDRNVRVALVQLMNREMMNEKFRFNMTDVAAGPTWLRNEAIADPKVKPFPFDPKKAAELLHKAGWKDRGQTGILSKEIDKKMTEFRFTLLLPVRDYEKYFTVYKEELKKAGIEMEIKVIEWNAFVSLLNDQKFDAVTMAWVPGSIEQDMKQIWHSTSAKPGGSNFISYANPEVDKWIDQAREEMNPKKRLELWRKVYRRVADDAPYAFMFSTRYDLYFAWKTIGMAKGTMKYDRGSSYWWKIAP